MNSKNSAIRVRAADRRLEALNLRRAGCTYDEIGRAMGVTRSRAHQLVAVEMEKVRKSLAEAVEDVRQQEIDRLDRLFRAHYPAAIDPAAENYQAVNAVLKIMERRSRLQGLDAPTKVESQLTVGRTPAELVEAARRHGLPLSREEETLLLEAPGCVVSSPP